MKCAGVLGNIIKYIRRYRQRFFYMAINIRQTAAFSERVLSNTRHGVADGHGGQTAATNERLKSNARHGVGDGDGGQTCATL